MPPYDGRETTELESQRVMHAMVTGAGVNATPSGCGLAVLLWATTKFTARFKCDVNVNNKRSFVCILS